MATPNIKALGSPALGFELVDSNGNSRFVSREDLTVDCAAGGSIAILYKGKSLPSWEGLTVTTVQINGVAPADRAAFITAMEGFYYHA